MAPAVAGDDSQAVFVGFKEAGNEGAPAVLEIMEDPDFVGKSLRGVGSVVDLDHLPVEG